MKKDDIIKYGVLIGSRAYGVNKQDSDYDLVLTEEDYCKVCVNNDLVSCSNIGKEDSDDSYDYSIFGSGLDDIGRFISDDGYNINVFLYTNEIGIIDNRIEKATKEHIYDRFMEHNKSMNSHSKEELQDRDTRILLFIHYLITHGITEYKID